MAISGSVPLSTIVIVACVCAVVIMALITVLIWLCIRRRAATRAKAAKAQQQDGQAHADKGSYKQGHMAGSKGNSLSLNNNNGGGGGAGGLHHHPAVAFVSPTTAATDSRCNRTSETCFDACDSGGGGGGGVGGGSSPKGSSSPHLGTVHLFPRAFYESDATDNSESPPTPNKHHRKIIYEVVV